jgi:hypothetical protein
VEISHSLPPISQPPFGGQSILIKKNIPIASSSSLFEIRSALLKKLINLCAVVPLHGHKIVYVVESDNRHVGKQKGEYEKLKMTQNTQTLRSSTKWENSLR